MVSYDRLRDIAGSAFWLVPTVCVIAAIVLAISLIFADHQLGQTRAAFLFPGSPNTARSFLSAIIQAMIAFTGLVFSITIVVLQLTSSQFSPRVLRTFLRDRTIQFSLGIFVATFVYAMFVLREVRGGEAQFFVPRIAVTVTFALVLLSVGLFISYISHVSNMIRLASIVHSIGEDGRALLRRRYPPNAPESLEPPALPPGRHTVPAPGSGVLVSVNETALVKQATEAGGLITVVPRVGVYVLEGAPLLRLHGEGDFALEQLTASCAFDIERTLEQDVAFPFRQLVDIAQKALSPGVNDPTTATQAIDVIHDLLRRLATRHLSSTRHRDNDGTPRLLVPEWGFAELLDLAVGQIWHYGSDAAQVPERLRKMLADLDGVAIPENQPAIRQWLLTVETSSAAHSAIGEA